MDTCTLWPDKWGSYDLSAACLLHDEDYAGQIGFVLANVRLYLNVSEINKVLAVVMLVGTMLFGWPWYLAAKIKKKRTSMSDEIERATDQQAHILATTISLVAGAARGHGESLSVCQECGARIPEARRQAMPGCELCLDCQTWVEKRGNFWP